jgi:hypothetical protein
LRPVATIAKAYGYYLGNPDGWDVKEANRFGALSLDWYYDVGNRRSCGEFIAAAMGYLSAHGALDGVAFHTYGDLAHPGSSDVYVVLVAEGSYQSTDSWGDSISMTPGGPMKADPEWDSRLTKALAVLGLTPHQEEPRWQFLPSLS